MGRECETNLKQIVRGFRECQSAFTAIGDETRQLILLTLLESDLSGIRVGEIAAKTPDETIGFSSSSDIEGSRHSRYAQGRNKELLLSGR